jgi:hypothetical protein
MVHTCTVYSVKLLIQVSHYSWYVIALNLWVSSRTPIVIVTSRLAARTCFVSDNGGKALATKPWDVFISAAIRLSALVVVHLCFLLYTVTIYESLNCSHIGKEEAASSLTIWITFLKSLYHIEPLSPYRTSRITVFNFSAILGDTSDMSKEKDWMSAPNGTTRLRGIWDTNKPWELRGSAIDGISVGSQHKKASLLCFLSRKQATILLK